MTASARGRWLALAGAAFALPLLPGRAGAHEVRPAYLQLVEREPGRFEVLWKLPTMGKAAIRLRPVLPLECRTIGVSEIEDTPGARITRWTVDCGPQGLANRTIAIDGLRRTLTDVLVRVEARDGSTQTLLLRPSSPSVEFTTESQASLPVAGYVRLGVEHILFGVDHLLFVLALLLVVGRRWRVLIKTVTAFTLAHSITLALATLGVVRVPPPPVEAVIALSIVFVAAEIVHGRQGRPGITARAPWVVAFTFGLLHGFGFAGALSQIGLPADAVPLALLLFNVGVELGQLAFVMVVVAAAGALRGVRVTWPEWAPLVPPYAIGAMAALWVIQRIAAFR